MAAKKDKDVVYEYPIDKDALRSFFLHPLADMTPTEERAIHMVISVVLNRHFGSYHYMFEDLRDIAFESVLMHHPKFDPSSNAHRTYGYVYTMCRNEVGNYLSRATRAMGVETLPENGKISDEYEYVFPQELAPLYPYLSGERPFSELQVPVHLIEPLLLFLESEKSPRLPDAEVVMKVLRKVLKVTYHNVKRKN